MVWPALPAMPLIDETPTIRPLRRMASRANSSSVDALGRGEVDRDHLAPLLMGHPPERLVARDAGVVDDDVDAAVVVEQMTGDDRGSVVIGDVGGQ